MATRTANGSAATWPHGHVDGALVFSVHLDDPLPGLVRRTGLPAVFGGRPGDPAATPYVDCDNRGGARAAVRHLASLGRRRIAHISGPLDQTSAVDRLDGWRDITGAAGAGLDNAPDLLASGDFTPEGGARAMSTLLERRPDLDAVFAASDLTASGALWTLRGAGLRVPEDVAVVGFDDLRTVAQHTDPPLTTVRQDIEEMGKLMARSLLDSRRGRGPPRQRRPGRDRPAHHPGPARQRGAPGRGHLEEGPHPGAGWYRRAQAPTRTVNRTGLSSCAAPETSGSPSGRTSS